ncbi:MAG: hypothetical protein GY792_26660 [Gammaproteobacteria bacterium]|nr:hypothetical protein [Gammaproteobacteria bacterium]
MKIKTMATEIATATEQQRSAVMEVSGNAAVLTQSGRNNLQSVERVDNTGENLSALSTLLNHLVEDFKV